MKPTEYWRWRIRSETAPFKLYNSKHCMTEAEALQRHPEAVRVPGSCEIRNLPETDEERLSNTSSAWLKPKG